MNTPGWWHCALTDALRWLLLPAVAAVLPARTALTLLRWAAARRWLMPEAAAVEQALAACFPANDPARDEYALTMLIEAMTLWRIRLGLKPRIEVRGKWPEQPGFAAVGGHFGNGIAVLWQLKRAGLKPRFLFRPPGASWKRERPLFWLWARVRYGVVMRLCDAQPLPTGGARDKLAAVLATGEVTPVILLDTPAEPGRDAPRLSMGKRDIGLFEGASQVLAEVACPIVLFVPRLEGANTVLELQLLDSSASSPIEAFAQAFAPELARRPGQWHSWPGIAPHLIEKACE
ncbi:MAG: hypothetical protein RQ729_08845 [Wenzhouxiangellaceae bacterium]|nr:hypothetical protein [Wenzhouxiangellaceae bacterium]